jgi:hypothetical protein
MATERERGPIRSTKTGSTSWPHLCSTAAASSVS